MRKIGLMLGLVVVVFACSEQAGQMLIDAGEMMQDAGDADAATMPDGSIGSGGSTGTGGTGGTPTTDITVTCNKSETYMSGDTAVTVRWAEFEIDPGATEVTVCYDRAGYIEPPGKDNDTCSRFKSSWFRGTSTGFAGCGRHIDYANPDIEDFDSPDPISITVHR